MNDFGSGGLVELYNERGAETWLKRYGENPAEQSSENDDIWL